VPRLLLSAGLFQEYQVATVIDDWCVVTPMEYMVGFSAAG